MSIFLCNFYKIFLTDGTVLPLTNNPVEKWGEIYDGSLSVYSLFHVNKLNTEETWSTAFAYEANTFVSYTPLTIFEKSFCERLPILQFGEGEDNTGPFCAATETSPETFKIWSNKFNSGEIIDMKFYKSLKRISNEISCDRTQYGLHCLSFTSKNGIENIEGILSHCNGSVLVDTDEEFKEFILQLFPKRSTKRNLLYKLSEDALEIGRFIANYPKGLNPLFDRVMSRSSEQGIYDYWYSRFLHAKGTILYSDKSFTKDIIFAPQNLASNILGVFLIYVILVCLVLLCFISEVIYYNHIMLCRAISIVIYVIKYSTSLAYYETPKRNTDNQFVLELKEEFQDPKKHLHIIRTLERLVK